MLIAKAEWGILVRDQSVLISSSSDPTTLFLHAKQGVPKEITRDMNPLSRCFDTRYQYIHSASKRRRLGMLSSGTEKTVR